jgi:hypothetical protein
LAQDFFGFEKFRNKNMDFALIKESFKSENARKERLQRPKEFSRFKVIYIKVNN